MVRVVIEDMDSGENMETICDDFVFAGSKDGEVHTAQTDNIVERSYLVAKLNKELQEDI